MTFFRPHTRLFLFLILAFTGAALLYTWASEGVGTNAASTCTFDMQPDGITWHLKVPDRRYTAGVACQDCSPHDHGVSVEVAGPDGYYTIVSGINGASYDCPSPTPGVFTVTGSSDGGSKTGPGRTGRTGVRG